jgi:exodeoxyribonuclease VII large subunit
MENIRETFHDHPVYSLSEIAFSLHKVVERTYPQPYFIKAEILKLNFYPHSGHCYPELVEKEGNSIKAEMRAIIWAANYQRINDRFIQITGNPLKENISILCLARIEFSPKHGLALHIEDIEPTYTLGEMVKNRNAVIERLKKEGVFTANKRLEMPLLPKRVAIISVETSKGYSDFITTLNGNRYGYRFVTELFPSILQGDKAIVGITGRLAEIEMRQKEFDCVVIVRGGGGDVGLSCYDEYVMAHRVATFPLPVLTGIGHSTNLSVTDMVAHTYNITPTDVAFALIGYFQTFDEKVQECQNRIVEVSRRLLVDEQAKLLRMTEAARMLPLVRLTEQQGRVGMIEEKVRLLHPENILKRGFSITRHNGKVVTNVADLKSGDELHTQVYEGEMTSIFYASQS